MKRKLFILLAVFFLAGCSLEEFCQEDCSSDGLSFSIDDAREFFEADYSAFRITLFLSQRKNTKVILL